MVSAHVKKAGFFVVVVVLGFHFATLGSRNIIHVPVV